MEKIMKKVSHLEQSSMDRSISISRDPMRINIIEIDQLPRQTSCLIQVECEGESIRLPLDSDSAYPQNYEFPFKTFMKHSWIKISLWQKRSWLGINKLQREEKFIGEASFNLTKSEIESEEDFWIDLIGQNQILPRFKIRVVYDKPVVQNFVPEKGMKKLQNLSLKPFSGRSNSDKLKLNVSNNKLELTPKLFDNISKISTKKKKKNHSSLSPQNALVEGNFNANFIKTKNEKFPEFSSNFGENSSFSTIDTNQAFSSPGSSSKSLGRNKVTNSNQSIYDKRSPSNQSSSIQPFPISPSSTISENKSSSKEQLNLKPNTTTDKDNTEIEIFDNKENNSILDELFSINYPVSNNSHNSTPNHLSLTTNNNSSNSIELNLENPFLESDNSTKSVTTLPTNFFPQVFIPNENNNFNTNSNKSDPRYEIYTTIENNSNFNPNGTNHNTLLSNITIPSPSSLNKMSNSPYLFKSEETAKPCPFKELIDELSMPNPEQKL